jgi:hypothetical protein
MATAEHCWDQWAYLSAEDCTQAEICSRCGLKNQNRRIEHDWGEWEYDQASRAPVRVCRRCGEMDVQISQALKVRSLPAAMDGNNGTRRAIPAPCFSDAYDAVESIPCFQTAAPDVEPVSESYQPDYNDPALKFEEESAGWPGGAYQNPDSDYYDPYTYDDGY